MTDLAATIENLPFQLGFATNLTEAENQRQRLLVSKKRYLLKSVEDSSILPISPTLENTIVKHSRDCAVTQDPALSFSHLLLAINSLRKPLKHKRKIMLKYRQLGQVVQKNYAKKHYNI